MDLWLLSFFILQYYFCIISSGLFRQYAKRLQNNHFIIKERKGKHAKKETCKQDHELQDENITSDEELIFDEMRGYLLIQKNPKF